jgi:hypothetical protein
MVTYMPMPRSKITLGATAFESTLNTATITRLENGFDTATIEIPDNKSAFYPTVATNGTAIQIDVKTVGGSYTTISKGIVRFPIFPQGNDEIIQLKCDGSGYGLADAVCAQEYGVQSRNPTLDTISEVVTDATNGLIPKYANKILGSATDSGFAYSTSVEAIAGTIPYLNFPYKPINKCLDDLCDLLTALKTGNAGPHWIVTTADYVLIKSIDQTLGGWTKYYGDSQANSTLTTADFTSFPKFEPMGPEANMVVYCGVWRRPSSGDAWTQGTASSWGVNAYTTATDDTGVYIIDSKSIKFTPSGGDLTAYYPSGKNAAWNFSVFAEFMTPTLNIYMRSTGRGVLFNAQIRLVDSDGDNLLADVTGTIASDDVWYHVELPIGTYYKQNHTSNNWTTETGTFNWADVDYIQIEGITSSGNLYIDGLNFGGVPIIRIAKNSTNITANKLKVKVITDNVGKDDSLVESDDSGLLAQMAYSELLRLQKSSIVGTVTTPMIADALPGQWFHIHAKKKTDGSFTIDADYRATKIIHTISPNGFYTTMELTNDLTNSHARPAYEDRNKLSAANRPEYQDRQAASIKAGEIDIRITPFTKDYPS